MVMEFFTQLMDIKLHRGKIKPIFKTEPPITHLIYADDLLIFMKADIIGAKAIKKVLVKLQKFTGLSINVDKSKIYFSKDCDYQYEICDILGINTSQFPVKYLGLPLSSHYIKDFMCNCLIDKIKSKVEGWESRLLSVAGRIQLINAVIHPLVLFWIQSFQLPVKTINRINKLCSNFLWNGKRNKIPWIVVCSPKDEGGMGLKRFDDINVVCCLKLIWKFLHDNNVFSKWMNNHYLKEQSFWETDIRSTHSGTWKNMLKNRNHALHLLDRRIVDGKSTSLWYDPWIAGSRLINMLGYQTLEILGGDSLCVDTILFNNSWNADHLSSTRGFKDIINSIPIYNNSLSDYWIWKDGQDGLFNFQNTWQFIRHKTDKVLWSSFVWDKIHCPKMAVCLYRAVSNRLATKDRLILQGMAIDSLCPLCFSSTESVSHLFFTCNYTSYIWHRARVMLCLPMNNHVQLLDEINFLSTHFGDKDRLRDLARLTMSVCVWICWKERNIRVFGGNFTDKYNLAKQVDHHIKILMTKSKKRSSNYKDYYRILLNWNLPDYNMDPEVRSDEIVTPATYIPNDLACPPSTANGLQTVIDSRQVYAADQGASSIKHSNHQDETHTNMHIRTMHQNMQHHIQPKGSNSHVSVLNLPDNFYVCAGVDDSANANLRNASDLTNLSSNSSSVLCNSIIPELATCQAEPHAFNRNNSNHHLEQQSIHFLKGSANTFLNPALSLPTNLINYAGKGDRSSLVNPMRSDASINCSVISNNKSVNPVAMMPELNKYQTVFDTFMKHHSQETLDNKLPKGNKNTLNVSASELPINLCYLSGEGEKALDADLRRSAINSSTSKNSFSKDILYSEFRDNDPSTFLMDSTNNSLHNDMEHMIQISDARDRNRAVDNDGSGVPRLGPCLSDFINIAKTTDFNNQEISRMPVSNTKEIVHDTSYQEFPISQANLNSKDYNKQSIAGVLPEIATRNHSESSHAACVQMQWDEQDCNRKECRRIFDPG